MLRLEPGRIRPWFIFGPPQHSLRNSMTVSTFSQRFCTTKRQRKILDTIHRHRRVESVLAWTAIAAAGVTLPIWLGPIILYNVISERESHGNPPLMKPGHRPNDICQSLFVNSWKKISEPPFRVQDLILCFTPSDRAALFDHRFFLERHGQPEIH